MTDDRITFQETDSPMETIIGLLEQSVGTHQHKAALRQKVSGVWQETTYRELWEVSDRVAAGLLKAGFKVGDHAALLAPSSPRWVCAYLGILKAGGVVVPIDKELKSAELRHILSDCDARYIFTDGTCFETLLESLTVNSGLERVIILAATEREPVAALRASAELDHLIEEWRLLVAAHQIPPEAAKLMEEQALMVHRLLTASECGAKPVVSHDPFAPGRSLRKQLVRRGRLVDFDEFMVPLTAVATPRRPTDTAMILYTSGTTGRSKGAMLSHANITSNVRGAAAHFNLREDIHTLSFLPLNHVFEQVCGVLLPLSLGGTVSFAESLRKLGENLAEVKPTFFLAVPAVFRMILDRLMKNVESGTITRLLFSLSLTRPLVRSRIRQTFGRDITFVSGGAALDPNVAQGLTDLGLTILQGYGITETSPVIAAEQPGRPRPGTVGAPLAGVEVRIEQPDKDGAGEILVRGPNVMQGYYRNPAATAEAIRDGWYRTGDLGRLDEEGDLAICGRLKNLIVTPNGKNVYPEEVEVELLKSPFIAEVMVYGHKVDSTEEEVHAVVFPNQEAIDDHLARSGKGPVTMAAVEELLRNEVTKACRGLADYKRVKKITVRDEEFPKTTTRKIKRYAVEARIPLKL
jgi:long-chain acyl-CoA synthetase